MSGAGNTFGSRLRDARERAGITLESIANVTKINQSLLAALERNDLSQWPKGIFRRAFLREYATAIGLLPEEVLVEFLRLFPEDEQPDPHAAQDAGEFRLTLAVEPRSRITFAVRRALAAMLDAGLVFLAGGIVVAWGSDNLWTASGVVGLVYYPLTVACLGQTLFSHWLCADVRVRRARHRAQDIHGGARNQLRIVSRRPDILQPIPQQENASAHTAAENRRAAST